MGKKLGLDDKYKILQGYKPAPRVRNIDPGMVTQGVGFFPKVGKVVGNFRSPTSTFAQRSATLGVGKEKSIVGSVVKGIKKLFPAAGSGAIGYELGKEYGKSEKKPTSKMYGGSAKKYKKGGMSMKDKKIKKVMGEYKKGELNIGKSKKKVKSKKQAIAIALASAKRKKA